MEKFGSGINIPDPQHCLCAAGWGAGVRGAPGEDPHPGAGG